MDLIVNSLYSNKDVFLRELVSNASDALDKIRFKSVQDASVLDADAQLEIRVKADPEANTLTIEDSGVGMTREELVSSLGTIANSGTRGFLEALEAQGGAADSNLIGQFGVGFYSAFLVADKVTVRTKSNDDGQQWRWESTVESSSYTIDEDDSGEAIARGTSITLHLKEDATDYADAEKLSTLLKQYSEFISFPIMLWKSESVPREVEDTEATTKKKEEWEAGGKEGDEPATVMKTEWDTVWDWRKSNESKPIWVRSSTEVEKAEYDDFFKATFKEFLEPLAHSHFSVEGQIEFKALLYVPGMAPFEQQDMMKKSRSMKLFVKRVFISDEFDEDLMPRYLSFIKGIVDSNDLPLNVSREILQESRVVRIIKRRLLAKSIDMIAEIANREDKADYEKFWEAFGRNVKLGVIEDKDNAPKLGKLLRFSSSKSGEGLTSLEEYVERMKEGQSGIYFLAADNRAAAERAPFVERLIKRDIEVLYLLEPIDEVALTNLAKFDEKEFVDVSKEDVDTGDEEDAKQAEEDAALFEGLTKWLASTIGSEQVEKVVVSKRLEGSPCILVTSKFGWSANMERIMKAQAMGDNRAFEYMKGRKIMEINPRHPVIEKLNGMVSANEDDAEAKAMAELLFDTALMTSGFQPEDLNKFADRIYASMALGASGSAAAPKSDDGGSERVDAEIV
eukprot:PRCOL_00005496-RA